MKLPWFAHGWRLETYVSPMPPHRLTTVLQLRLGDGRLVRCELTREELQRLHTLAGVQLAQRRRAKT